MTILQPHQQRVVDEHAELKEKFDKLHVFFNNPMYTRLSTEEQNLLCEQATHMEEYLWVLTKRIRAFTGTKLYVCHKKVLARPMTRGDYNTLQGWTIPANENPSDEGYLVEYLESGKPNHPDFQHYISWSPKDVFEAGYKEKA